MRRSARVRPFVRRFFRSRFCASMRGFSLFWSFMMSISRTSLSPLDSVNLLLSDTSPVAVASLWSFLKLLMSNSISFAISLSVGILPRCASSVCSAFSSWCALDLTSLGTQSMLLNSSRIAPLMRGVQYVSNLTPLSGSNASIASMSPKIPALMRSSSSTLSGSFA